MFMIQVLVFLEAFAEEKETSISFKMFLRWLETVSVLSKTYSLMGHYNLSLSVDGKIMVSTKCPLMIGERVAFNFVAQ